MTRVLLTIFKCSKCETIFNKKSIVQMQKFIANITSHEDWPQLCLRDKNSAAADGFGCSEKAYVNLTSKAEDLIRLDPYVSNSFL
jgi:hypothetical protein